MHLINDRNPRWLFHVLCMALAFVSAGVTRVSAVPGDRVYEASDVMDVTDQRKCDKRSGDPITGWVITRWPGGALATREMYKAGMKDGMSFECDQQGKCVVVVRCKNGVYDGVMKRYGSSEGRRYLRLVATFKHGVLEGRYVEYYESGAAHFEGSYLHGRKQGTWTVYAASGKVQERMTFPDHSLPSTIVTAVEAGAATDVRHQEGEGPARIPAAAEPNTAAAKPDTVASATTSDLQTRKATGAEEMVLEPTTKAAVAGGDAPQGTP